MSTAQLSSPPTLLTRGAQLAQTLRREKRHDEATTVDRLVSFKSQFAVLPLSDLADRLTVSQDVIRLWVDRGQITALISDDQIIVSAEKLRALDEMNALLADLDETCPPLSDEELNTLFEPDRKDWTWIGKET